MYACACDLQSSWQGHPWHLGLSPRRPRDVSRGLLGMYYPLVHDCYYSGVLQYAVLLLTLILSTQNVLSSWLTKQYSAHERSNGVVTSLSSRRIAKITGNQSLEQSLGSNRFIKWGLEDFCWTFFFPNCYLSPTAWLFFLVTFLG